MKIEIDQENGTLRKRDGQSIPLYSDESFEILSEIWLKVGWNQKHVYTFTWMGRPIIQLPEDVMRIQEVIYSVRPDVIIETGIAHGGSLVLYASLCKAMGCGRIIGVDIEIRAHNRKAIESHELSSLITLIEANSVNPDTVSKIKKLLLPKEKVLVILDSNHSKAHVLKELELYSAVVSKDSYIVATDGSMKDLHDVPRGKKEWISDNPVEAVKEFLKSHPDFTSVEPAWKFNESRLSRNITHWPSAYLLRTRS